MSDTQIRTPEMDITKIDIVEGFNARKEFDEGTLAELAETIKTDGLVQPIAVRPTESGRADLVAGERRFQAAKLAGLKRVPVTVPAASARAAAFFENAHREELNPIETALDLKAFAEEFGLSTNKQVAARAKKKVPWVSEHLRLLKLPEEVQRYVAAGVVPPSAGPKLRKIADVSPEIAAHICEFARRCEISGSAFVETFGDIFIAAGNAVIKGKPTMIGAFRFALSDAVSDPETHALFAERINATLPPYRRSEDPRIELSDAEIDAARAAGCLVEYRIDRPGYSTTPGYLTDKEFTADLVARLIDRLEKEMAEKVKAEKVATAKRKEVQKQLRGEAKASGEETPQARAKKRKEIARSFNGNLKRALLRKRTVARRKKHALIRAKAVACQFISDNPNLAGRGLRLVSDQLQNLEVKSLKSGGRREKVNYADAEQSTADLERRIGSASDPLEVIEILSEALLAAILSDGEEPPGKDRICWYTPVEGQLKKLLANEIKEVRPRQSRRPL